MCSQKEYLHGVSIVKVSDLYIHIHWVKSFEAFMAAYVHLYHYDLSFV